MTLALAPLTPFITERVWQDMFASTSDQLPESVHLADWPRIDASLVDDDLAEQMRLARRLVELGRAARADAKVRTRQPLRRALVATAAHDRLSEELRGEIAEELNIGAIEPLSAAGADLVDSQRQGQLPRAGQALRQGHPAGGRGDRRSRRRGALRGAQGGRPARSSTSTASPSRCSPTR